MAQYYQTLMVLLLLVPMTPCYGQSKKASKKATPAPVSAPKRTEWPVSSLKVEGLQTYTVSQVLAVAGVKVGELATKERFEAARDRLVATAAFDQVSYKYAPAPDGKSFAAVFQVREALPVYPVRFEDLPGKPDDLMDVLKKSDPMFGPKIPGTAPILRRYAAVLQEFLKEGVTGRVAPAESGELGAVFGSTRQPPSVAEVYFKGNKAIQTLALQTAVSGVAIGLVYQERRFRLQLDLALRPLYEAMGYVRVSFPSIELKPAEDVNGVVATVTVDEGAIYNLARVDVAGAPPPGESAGGFKTEGVFDIKAVEAGREKVEKALRKAGYIRVKSSFERSYNDAKKTVSLVLRVEAGPQFALGKLEILGLDIQTEPAIRKMWSLKQGSPFNVAYPDYFLQRLREDAVFDNLGETKSAININDSARTVDVTLYFRGAPPVDERRRKKQPF